MESRFNLNPGERETINIPSVIGKFKLSIGFTSSNTIIGFRNPYVIILDKCFEDDEKFYKDLKYGIYDFNIDWPKNSKPIIYTTFPDEVGVYIYTQYVKNHYIMFNDYQKRIKELEKRIDELEDIKNRFDMMEFWMKNKTYFNKKN
jgi:hypothetical protein